MVLIGLFTELAKHPECIDKCYAELKDVNVADQKTLAKLPHLNAVILETMRLYPALMTGGSRKTGMHGITVAGKFIPPHTTIVAPQYVITRSESPQFIALLSPHPAHSPPPTGEDCFEQPLDFVPERWTTRREMVRDSTASTPFGTGRYNCIGRTLAMNIMRYVVARLLQSYT